MYYHSFLNLAAHCIEAYSYLSNLFIDCGECVRRLVSIITSIEALLQGVVRSVDTLVVLHQLDVDGLSNMSTRVNEIMVRHTPFHSCLCSIVYMC